MVNWKKFFSDEIEEEKEIGQEKKSPASRSKFSQKLQAWFEETTPEEKTRQEENEDFEIEYADDKKSTQKNTLKEGYDFEENDFKEEIREKTGFSKYDDFSDSETEMDSMIEEISRKEENKAKEKSRKDSPLVAKLKSYMVADEEIFDEYDKEEKPKSKLVSLFESDETEEDLDEYEEVIEVDDIDEDDEAEDYKTYLERTKATSKTEEKDRKNFFSNIKSSLQGLFPKKSSEKTEQVDLENSEEDFEILFSEDKKASKEEQVDKFDFEEDFEKDFGSGLEKSSDDVGTADFEEDFQKDFDTEFAEDISKYEEDLDYIFEEDFEKTEEDISDKLEELEYHSKEEVENKGLETSLKSLGIDVENIKDVDLFEERAEDRSRRLHPTLSSVKVRRILQEKEIDGLNYDIALEENKDKFVKSLQKTDTTEDLEDFVEEEHKSKNQDDIEKLNQDFNTLSRKSEKITLGESVLRERDSEKIDGAIRQIRVIQKESERDKKDYSIQVETNEDVARREKLSYTSVDDVLLGSEDLFESDIDKDFDFSEDILAPKEVEDFRESVFKKKESEDLVSGQPDSELDKLILETKIVENKKEESQDEIEKLEENLSLIKEYNKKKQEKQEQVEELTLEKVVEDSQYNFEDYEDIKVTSKREVSYSDYELSQDEIDSLKVQSEIDYKSNIDIDNLNEEIGKKHNDFYDFDFEDEWQMSTKKVEQTREVEKEEVGIDYKERLYTNDVGEYFVEDNAPLTFGEYKTQDRGYRPVSKEKMEENKRKLEAIFEKYSNVTIPKRNTTAYVEQKISNPVRVDKYKPSQVVSVIHGTKTPTPSSTTKVTTKTEKTKVKETKTSKKTSPTNYFEEIASQKEISWEIGASARVPKKKIKK